MYRPRRARRTRKRWSFRAGIALLAGTLAAARDSVPFYYARYIVDKHNKSPEVQQAAIDNAHYFYSPSPADRRAYSEQMVTNFADPMTASWPNWAKIFFNNKGVAAKETDH